jgi:SPX domain protein involved in polyphosphate accumulation
MHLELETHADVPVCFQVHADTVTNLLEFVSLNMTAVRKILKKFKKHIEPLAPIPGFLTLEVGPLHH